MTLDTAARTPVSFLATSDAGAAAGFYRDVLGLELIETSPYALVFREAGQTLRVQIVEAFEPAGHTVFGWEVADIASQIRALVAQGVTFLTFKHLPQDPQGIWTTPQGNKIAWFQDPDGNLLSFTEYAAG